MANYNYAYLKTGGAVLSDDQNQREISTLEKRIHMTLLYDLYSPLLTGKQREIFELHEILDLSLSEISEKLGISRQAAHDVLNRSWEKLEKIDIKLGFSFKSKRQKELMTGLEKLMEESFSDIPQDFYNRALKIINTARGEL